MSDEPKLTVSDDQLITFTQYVSPWTIELDHKTGSVTFILRDREREERHCLTAEQVCDAMRTLARMALGPSAEKNDA